MLRKGDKREMGQPGVRVLASLPTVQPRASQLLYLKPLSSQQQNGDNKKKIKQTKNPNLPGLREEQIEYHL